MGINRRDFVRVGTAALVGSQVPNLLAQSRTLFFRVNAFAVLVAHRASGSGIPGTTSKAQILFIDHPDHEPATLLIPDSSAPGGVATLVLDRAELQITGLLNTGANSVKLDNGAETPCPNGLQWKRLTSIAQMERVIGPTAVKASCLQATNPTDIGGRITIDRGELVGSYPEITYNGEQLTFPKSVTPYERAFTDSFEWHLPIVSSGPITLSSVPFDKTKKPQVVKIDPTGNLTIDVWSPRRSGTGLTSGPVLHFAHYYQLLDYTGTNKPLPEPATATCGQATVQFSPDQRDMRTEIQRLRAVYRKSKPMQKYFDENPPAGGPSADSPFTSAATMRGEGNYCYPVMVLQSY